MPYYERRIYCGDLLEVKRYCGTKGGRPLGSKKTGEGKSSEELNDAQSWRKLHRQIACNFSPKNGDMCLTLTFRTWVDRQTALKAYEKFLRQIRAMRKKRGLGELKYIIVKEVQSGRQHAHVIVNGGIELKDLQALWGMGTVWAKVLEDTHNYKELASYLMKQHKPRRGSQSEENAKDPRQKGQRRWTCSRNLQKPEVKKRECRPVTMHTLPRAPKGYRLLPDFVRDVDLFGNLWMEWTCIREEEEKTKPKRPKGGKGRDDQRVLKR